MLRNLQISNYALIDNLAIEFQPGLNIITGETGAGKSILLGALSLILGQRADSSVLKDKTKNCVVEGTFDISEYDLQDFFAVNDIDYEKNTIVRRQINDSGKSRAFINEIPVNLNVLKDFSELLIDIHSQHENLLLGNNQFQLNIIDSYASLQNDVSNYQIVFKKYKQVKVDLDKMIDEASKSNKDLDYFKFQLDELVNAKLKVDELSDLETLQKELSHSTEIKESLQKCIELLSGDSSSIIEILREIETTIKKITPYYPFANEIISRLETSRIELKDLATETTSKFEKMDVDPTLLENTTQRLNLLYSLLQKHRLNSMEDLINLQEEIEKKVLFISNLDFNIEQVQKELNEIQRQLKILATSLHNKRVDSVPALEKSIIDLLVQLGMNYADFRVEVKEFDDFQSYGIDRVTFLFSANKQIPLQDIAKVASGGELSRLMLSLKSMKVKSTGLPTIIFDEIDSGVSGDIADKMGNIISSMSEDMQVINITHLPQIASKGKNHFLVYKGISKTGTETNIKLLTPEERVKEVAKMLSGEKITEAALKNARELLSSNSTNRLNN